MLISVIIPTHERCKYVVPTIRSVFELGEDVEVVVTDTSLVDEITPHFTKEISNSSRLKIIRPNKKLNVVQNFELGCATSTGDYLIFLGDDDFLHGSIVDIVGWARKNNIDSLKSTLPAHYFWPDFIHKRHRNFYSGKIIINDFTGCTKKLLTKAAVKEVADNLGAGVLNMPRAYAGVISRTLVNTIIVKYGSLFGGVSPDIYSSTLISIESMNCVEIDYPFIIPGSSGMSTAGLSANGKHVGGLRDNPHISAFEDLKWNPLVPEFYSVPTVWSYSFIEAFSKVGHSAINVNYLRLYAKCFFSNPSYWREILRSFVFYAKKHGYPISIFGLLKCMIVESVWILKKIINIIRFKIVKPINHVLIADDSFFARQKMEVFLRSKLLKLDG